VSWKSVPDGKIPWEAFLVLGDFSAFKNPLSVWPVLIPDCFNRLYDTLVLETVLIGRFADQIGVYLKAFKGLNCVSPLQESILSVGLSFSKEFDN
jgi:hypothetical protein